jgi:hypothetical protein
MNEGMTMTRRTYRLSAAMVGVGLLICALTGCFGSGEDAVDTTSPATLPASDTTSSSLTASSADDSTLVDGLPRQYVEALGTRPIVVLFYVPAGVDDEKVLGIVRELRTAFSNYTFLTYDYRIPSAYGDLSKILKIDYQPEIVLIDRHGAVQKVWSGYVDKASVNQTLITLGRY